MNYKHYLIILVFSLSTNCSVDNINTSQKTQFNKKYTNKGFTLVFNEDLFKKKIITKKIDNRSYFIFNRNLKKNSSVKVTNLLNNKTIIAKVKSTRAIFPSFFNSVITKRISEDLEIDLNEPYVEISLISNNSSFVAKKTKTWKEEMEVAEKAPVDGIIINDLSNSSVKKKVTKSKKFLYSIKIADFYYEKSALQMLDRIKSETSIEKFNIINLSKTNFRVLLGPFNDMNSLKKSYNKALLLNFENLEIIRHD
tara:strand:+ start:54 stop:812 length:759 start_codon:yes stop_codon:yes gene_type:complete